jgi:hypothetical protein
MSYKLNPFNPNNPYDNQVSTELNYANDNFSILGQAFLNSDPSSNPVFRASYVGSSAPNNPVAGTTWLDTSSSPSVIRVYDGSNWQSSVVSVSNFSNISYVGSSSPSNYSKGTAWLDTSQSNPLLKIYDGSNWQTIQNGGSTNRVDLSNATSDYNLDVGQEAIINFNNATSVPLHIATKSGTYYEMYMACSTSIGQDSNVCLNPNNTTYSNAFVTLGDCRETDGTTGEYDGIHNAFRFGASAPDVVAFISNFTTFKSVKSDFMFVCTSAVNNSTDYGMHINANIWKDTTTEWTSLGTITFPQQTTGFILVRRLV